MYKTYICFACIIEFTVSMSHLVFGWKVQLGFDVLDWCYMFTEIIVYIRYLHAVFCHGNI